MDPSVRVGIEKSKSLLVEFEAVDRAAEDCPQFAVELTKMCNIRSLADINPYGSS
jgi:hypothetical protein